MSFTPFYTGQDVTCSFEIDPNKKRSIIATDLQQLYYSKQYVENCINLFLNLYLAIYTNRMFMLLCCLCYACYVYTCLYVCNIYFQKLSGLMELDILKASYILKVLLTLNNRISKKF